MKISSRKLCCCRQHGSFAFDIHCNHYTFMLGLSFCGDMEFESTANQ